MAPYLQNPELSLHTLTFSASIPSMKSSSTKKVFCLGVGRAGLADSSWESPGQGGLTEELPSPLPNKKFLESFLNVPYLRLGSMSRDQSSGTSSCTQQTEFTEGGRKGGEDGGCFGLAYVFCQSEMSSLCGQLNGSHGTSIWAQQSVEWLLSFSTLPHPGLGSRPMTFRKSSFFSTSYPSSFLGIAAANPVFQSFSLSQ